MKSKKAGAPAPSPVTGLLDRLGLIGLDSIEPVVLAALATQAPLLLIGTHGSGKSLLLERIANALHLSWRHYNASLLNFDDLVGYPMPDASGQLRFIQTPASIWGAQAVFIDEISRARIDIQNRLFPIIHEKRVQGLALEELEHRWAAMNPPAFIDDDEDPAYAGSEPLDLALSDRFAFQVRMPDWRQFQEKEQEAVVLADLHVPDATVGRDLARLLHTANIALRVTRAQWAKPVARYVRLFSGLLESSSHVLSARRAGMLVRNILAVHCIAECRDAKAQIADSVWLAVLHSMPFTSSGIRVKDSVLLACHKEAWRSAALEPDDPLGEILAERDPIRRVQRALCATVLPEGELTTIISDSLSQLPDGARQVLAAWVLESGHAKKLSVVAADEAALAYKDVVCVQEVHEQVRPNSQRHKVWRLIEQRLGRLDPNVKSSREQANLLTSLFSRNLVRKESEVDDILAAFHGAHEKIYGASHAAITEVPA